MNITKEQNGNLNATIKIEIDTTDYLSKTETALKTLGKKVDMKGFRKGMVPAGLVKKMYGNSVLADELDKLINDSMNNYLKEHDVQILGNPLPILTHDQGIDINSPKNYEFTFELGLAPEFDLSSFLNKKTLLTEYVVVPNDEEIEEELLRMRKRFGKMSNPNDGVKDDDVMYCKWQELDNEGNLRIDGVNYDSVIAVDMIADKTTLSKVIGMKPGESVDVDIFALLDKDRKDIAKQILGVDGHAAEHLNDIFRLTLQKINRVELSDLNQELFNQVLGKDAVTTEEEFRTQLVSEISKAFGSESKRRFVQDLVDDLTESIKIDLPDEFLKRWLKEKNEKPITVEEVEEGYPDFARNLKWQLIVNKIGKENNLEVKAEDIFEETKANIIKQFGAMPGFDFAGEQLDGWVNEMMNNKEHVQKTYEYLMEQQLIEYIKGQITVSEKPLTLQAFRNLK